MVLLRNYFFEKFGFGGSAKTGAPKGFPSRSHWDFKGLRPSHLLVLICTSNGRISIEHGNSTRRRACLYLLATMADLRERFYLCSFLSRPVLPTNPSGKKSRAVASLSGRKRAYREREKEGMGRKREMLLDTPEETWSLVGSMPGWQQKGGTSSSLYEGRPCAILT